MVDKRHLVSYNRHMTSLIIAYLLSTLAFFSSLYALARVRRLTKLTSNVGYETFADLESDVGALKSQLRKLNGRISGLNEPKHDSLAEARAIMEAQQQLQMQNQTNNIKSIGG